MLATWVQCSPQHTWFLPPSTDNNNHFEVFSSSDVQQYICILSYVVKFCKIHPMFYCMLFVCYFAYLTFLYLNLLKKNGSTKAIQPPKIKRPLSRSYSINLWTAKEVTFLFSFSLFLHFLSLHSPNMCEFINQVSSTSH